MSRRGVIFTAIALGVLALPVPLLARDYTTWALYEPHYYQPHYLPSVDEASNRLQFLSPHFAPVTAQDELTTGYALQRVDVNRLGINLSFTKSGVDQSVQYFWSWWGGYVAPVTTPYTNDIVASIVYADVASFELYHNERAGVTIYPAAWCVDYVSRGASRGNAVCVPKEADAHRLIDALATLVVASGQSLDIPPGVTVKATPEKESRNHPERSGMEITNVVPDAPPALAGIRKGDILHSINGQPCTGEQAFSDLLNKAVREKPEGGVVHAEILRKGNSMAFDLHYANPDANVAQLRQQSAASARHPVGSVIQVPAAAPAAPPSAFHLGIRVRAVTEADVAVLGLPNPKGVVVTGVDKGGLGDEMQMQVGDTILAVNGSEIADVDSFGQVVRSGAARSFKVWRKGQLLELTVPQSM
jgi:membrane-associated protease RseP (regulator of RpoE activity)